MIEKLLIGTGNKHKLALAKKYLSDLSITLVTPAELGIIEEPEETGSTFEENAIIKARFYFQKSGLPTLTDDAGFEIPALNNFPGVHSRRFAGKDLTDQEVIDTILEKMKGLQGEQRKARMKLVCALALSDAEIHTAVGLMEGHVPEIPYERISTGMPYRSLLFVDSKNKWFDQLIEDGEEGSLGYRKDAINQLKKYLI